jgi:hypothetical protein
MLVKFLFTSLSVAHQACSEFVLLEHAVSPALTTMVNMN